MLQLASFAAPISGHASGVPPIAACSVMPAEAVVGVAAKIDGGNSLCLVVPWAASLPDSEKLLGSEGLFLLVAELVTLSLVLWAVGSK